MDFIPGREVEVSDFWQSARVNALAPFRQAAPPGRGDLTVVD